MKILWVKIENILSIEKAFVEFDAKGLMLIQGWNHDVGRANGAGKTAIFNAITFALYDKLPRKITATEILRRGTSSGHVELLLEIAGDQYVVRRSRPKGVAFFKGKEPLAVTQEGWERLLGLNYTQFTMSMYCAQSTPSRFLSINDSGKKQFLLQLLNLEEFSSCKLTADKKAKKFEEDLAAIQSRMDASVAKIEAYNESLVDESTVREQLVSCKTQVGSLTALLNRQQAVARPDLSKYAQLEEDLSVKVVEVTRAKARREMLHESYRKFQSRTSAVPSYADKCRSCGTSLDVTAARAAHERELAECRTEMSKVKTQIHDAELVISGSAKLDELANKIREKKKKDTSAFEKANVIISDLKSKIALTQQEAQNLALKLQSNSELQSKIQVLLELLAKMSDQKANVIREIELYRSISSMYSPTGAQAYILDSVIDSFNTRVSSYVNLLWSNMTYELNSYKENVDGEITAKFSENLVMDGKPVSLGSLSGGEFRALSLCVDFALIDVMESEFGLTLSPIVLDEPFDGLDMTGREVIVDLLENISVARQIVVVDHTSEIKSMFSKVLSVDKRSGVSTVSVST